MYLESNGFNPNAISPTGAAGLGQFTKATWIQTVDHSSHPELKKIAGLSYNQLLLKRHDPHLNALATGEYIGVAYQKLKRAFTANNIKDENGKIAEPAMAELYSYHNTGNAGVALAARQGLTVRDAPIMNMQQKQAAVDNNKGLYPQGIDTPAREYMRLVEEKLQQGLKYQDFSSENEPQSTNVQVSSSSPKISLVDQSGLAITDPTVLAETSKLYADNALAGRLGGFSDGTNVVSRQNFSAAADGKNPPATTDKQNPPATTDKVRAIQEMLKPNPIPLLDLSVTIPNLDKTQSPSERYYKPIDQKAIDRTNAGFIATMSWGGGVLPGAAATTTYKSGGTAAQVDGAATTASLLTSPKVAARVRQRTATSSKPANSTPSTAVAKSGPVLLPDPRIIPHQGSSIRMDGHKIYASKRSALGTKPDALYRFSDPSYRKTGKDVYFGENVVTAYMEVKKDLDGKSLFIGDVRVGKVLDLTDPVVLRQMNINKGTLTKQVNNDIDVNKVYSYTNKIANQAYDAGYTGIMYSSTRKSGNNRALILFGGRYDPAAIEVISDRKIKP